MNLVHEVALTIEALMQELTRQLQELLAIAIDQFAELPQMLWQSYCNFMRYLVETYGEEPAQREPYRKGKPVSYYIPPGGYWVITKAH